MSELQNYISFMRFDSGTQFTPTLVGMAFVDKKHFEIKEISELQARLEAKEYFDKIREWNLNQDKPEPDPLVMEMANF